MLTSTTRHRSFLSLLALSCALLLFSGAASADYAAGLKAFNQQDFRVAFAEWIESAKAGDAHAQHGVGLLYEMGQGVPYEDPKTAAEWYEKAAAQNYAPAINNLARLYADGRGVKQDAGKAIELWSKAAAAGNVTARFNLGLQHESGIGVAKDPKKASEYILQAAEGGLAEAQFTMATRYRDGIGVAKDVDAARLWFDRAATAGYEPARQQLAALEKTAPATGPVVSAAPAVESAPTEPAEQTPAVKPEETKPAEAKPAESAETKPAETKPAETKPAETKPAETKPEETPEIAAKASEGEAAPSEPAVEQHGAENPPAETAPTETPPVAAEGTAQTADAGHAPEEPAEEQAPEQIAADAEHPAEGESVAPDWETPADTLPRAESLTGEARVYRIWLYETVQENDAKMYWDKLIAQYPTLLNPLTLDLRAYKRRPELGTAFRVFAGPFEDLGAAQKACADIKERFGDQFCRAVIN